MNMQLAARSGTALILSIVVTAGWAREWNDITGKYQLEAVFVRIDGEQVLLQRADSTTASVQIGRLCKADQVYIRQQLGAAQNPLVAQVERLQARPTKTPIVQTALLQPAPTDGGLPASGPSGPPSSPPENYGLGDAYVYESAKGDSGFAFYMIGDSGVAKYGFREPYVRYSGSYPVSFYNYDHLVRVKQIPSPADHQRWILLETFGSNAPYVNEFALDRYAGNNGRYAVWYKNHRGWWSFFGWAGRRDYAEPGYGHEPCKSVAIR